MRNREIDNGQTFDFGRTSPEYAKYRDIYPAELGERLLALGVGAAGCDWLDLGTGTGVLPRMLAHQGARITALDISENQIAEAVRLSDGMNNISYRVAAAEETGCADHSFDAVSAVQCFWYFDRERMKAEIRRILRPDGIFVKVYVGWMKDDPVASASSALVKELNPDWNSGSPAVNDLRMHIFANPIMESFTADLPFTRESWHGRMLSCRGVLGSMNLDMLTRFVERHTALMERFPENFTVKHKLFITAYRMADQV